MPAPPNPESIVAPAPGEGPTAFLGQLEANVDWYRGQMRQAEQTGTGLLTQTPVGMQTLFGVDAARQGQAVQNVEAMIRQHGLVAQSGYARATAQVFGQSMGGVLGTAPERSGGVWQGGLQPGAVRPTDEEQNRLYQEYLAQQARQDQSIAPGATREGSQGSPDVEPDSNYEWDDIYGADE